MTTIANYFSSAPAFLRSYLEARNETTATPEGKPVYMEAHNALFISWSYLHQSGKGADYTKDFIKKHGFDEISKEMPHIFRFLLVSSVLNDVAMQQVSSDGKVAHYRQVLDSLSRITTPASLAAYCIRQGSDFTRFSQARSYKIVSKEVTKTIKGVGKLKFQTPMVEEQQKVRDLRRQLEAIAEHEWEAMHDFQVFSGVRQFLRSPYAKPPGLKPVP